MTKKKKRRFLSEFCANLCTSNWLMIPSDQINADGEMGEEEAEISKRCHIYLICRRPATSYVKDSLTYEDGRLKVKIAYKVGGEEHTIDFDNLYPLLDDAVTLSITDYPHREIKTFDADGNEVRRVPANTLSVGLISDHLLKQLEVLYVGQAFGNGSRTAHERLKSHSTLQKILAEGSYKYPDSEISVLTFEYEPYRLIMSFDGRSEGTISDERDKKRFYSIQDNPLTVKKQIGLAEAALIRYFQPEYNVIFKIKFPSPKVKLLQKCFELDFSGLCVEINTDELGFKLYSETRPAKMHHISNIDLVNDESRASFFYMAGRDGGVVKMNDVIDSKTN
jgi:hypothetical protein